MNGFKVSTTRQYHAIARPQSPREHYNRFNDSDSDRLVFFVKQPRLIDHQHQQDAQSQGAR